MTRILIVDDSKFSRSLMKAPLTQAGYQVDEREDPESALAYLKEQKPDIILTDLKMPGIEEGLDFLLVLSLNYYLTPILICTADGNARDAVSEMGLEFFDFLIKPVSKSALLEAIGHLLRNKNTKEATIRLGKNGRLIDLNH